MDVQLDDPAERQRRMWWLRGAGFALVLLAPMLASGGLLESLLVLLGYEMFFLSPLAARLATESQQGRLALQPGAVVVTTRRGRTVLRTRDLQGATAASIPGDRRIVLSLSLGKLSAYPVSIVFDRVDEMESVRRALGVGQLGNGTVSIAGGKPGGWPRVWRGMMLALAVWAPFALLTAEPRGWVLFVLLLATLIGEQRSERTIEMRAGGMMIGGPVQQHVAYTDVTRINDDGDRLTLFRANGAGHAWLGGLDVPARGLLDPFSTRERALLVAQLRAAVERSRDTPRVRFDADETLGQLRRLSAQGEGPAGWLSRLDAVAALSDGSSAGAGYRGASLDVDALWTTLEDPDADLELRCAAARILRRRIHDEEPLRVRIATAVESVHDDVSRARLRLMTEEQPAPDDLDAVFATPGELRQRY